MICRSYTIIVSVQWLHVPTFQHRYSSCWVPGDIVFHPFCDLYCHKQNKGELLFNILLYEFGHITKTGRMDVTMTTFSQLSFMHERSSETPQCVTQQMDLRGLHAAADHCYLQYNKLYSAWFEINKWIDYMITILFLFSYDVDERSPP